MIYGKIICRIIRNRAPIGKQWRAQVGSWEEDYSSLMGTWRNRFNVIEESWFSTKAEAKEWAESRLVED